MTTAIEDCKWAILRQTEHEESEPVCTLEGCVCKLALGESCEHEEA